MSLIELNTSLNPVIFHANLWFDAILPFFALKSNHERYLFNLLFHLYKDGREYFVC